jgi:hypothetical protein
MKIEWCVKWKYQLKIKDKKNNLNVMCEKCMKMWVFEYEKYKWFNGRVIGKRE